MASFGIISLANNQMPKIMQSTPIRNPPGTAPEPRFSADNFDSILPPEVLDELLRCKPRSFIPPAPSRAPGGQLKAAIGYLGLIALPVFGLIFLISLSSSWHPSFAARASSLVATPPQPRVFSTPPPPEVRVLRAELVPVEVRRAALMRLPGQVLGEFRWYALPESVGGGEVQARFLGTVNQFSDIPKNPTPGDMWNVTETGNPWIYCIPMGGTHYQWIDP